eukprot:5482970-Amphidinium_carterae.1
MEYSLGEQLREMTGRVMQSEPRAATAQQQQQQLEQVLRQAQQPAAVVAAARAHQGQQWGPSVDRRALKGPEVYTGLLRVCMSEVGAPDGKKWDRGIGKGKDGGKPG